MIDLKRLRDDPEYRRGIERKRVPAGLVDEVIALDNVYRQLLSEVETLRARQNAASAEIKNSGPGRAPGEDPGRGRGQARTRRPNRGVAGRRRVTPLDGAAAAECGRPVGARRRRRRRRGDQDHRRDARRAAARPRGVRRSDRVRRQRARRGGQRFAIRLHHRARPRCSSSRS